MESLARAWTRHGAWGLGEKKEQVPRHPKRCHGTCHATAAAPLRLMFPFQNPRQMRKAASASPLRGHGFFRSYCLRPGEVGGEGLARV
jgi:hypothetical protein